MNNKRRDFCKKGHDLRVVGVIEKKGRNGKTIRRCAACKAAYDRAYNKTRREKGVKISAERKEERRVRRMCELIDYRNTLTTPWDIEECDALLEQLKKEGKK